MVQVGRLPSTATAIDGSPTSVSYNPPPPEPKRTELPTAPEILNLPATTSDTHASMMWRRINDSLHRDNVLFYELELANLSDFSDATRTNLGNTAPGANAFEFVSHTASGLMDDATYWVRVRAVNHVGVGAWSAARSVRVNIQDPPLFDVSNPVFPANGSTGVSRTPALEVSVSDPEGDRFYVVYEIAEAPNGPWRLFTKVGNPDFLNVTRLDPSEINPPLKPDTRYVWRASVIEEGRDRNYYGGAWPTSPIWEFTTENVAGAYSITQVQHLSGEIKPFERVTYRVTVTNSGNGVAPTSFVEALYVKNNLEHPFHYNAPGHLPLLNPGESATTDVTVLFRDTPFGASNGVTYDNVLVSGASVLRFRASPVDGTGGIASHDLPIHYTNQGGPTFELYVRGPTTNNPNSPRGGFFEIIAGISDDIRTTRVLIDYRVNPSSPWLFLDEFTGNSNPWFSFQTTSHSGPTVPGSQNSTNWTFPANWAPTSTLQIRLTAFDDAGAYTSAVSSPMTIYDDTLEVDAGAVQFPSYRLGDVAMLPLNVRTPMLVNAVSVDYVYGNSTVRVYNLTDANGIDVPPVLAVTLPVKEAHVNAAAKLRVQVSATIPGVVQRTSSDESDGTFSVTMPDLPAPFNSAVTLFSENFSFPPGSLYRQEITESVALDWEGDSVVHAVVRQSYGYNFSENYTGAPEFTGDQSFHVRYNRQSNILDQVSMPAGYLCDDVKVIGAAPYFLLRNGNDLYVTSRTGGNFGPPQFVTSIDGLPANQNAELMRRGNELYLTWQANTSQAGANWRHRLKRILPTVGPVVEHPIRIDGNHLDYGSHLNTAQGLYSLNPDLTAATPVVIWSYGGNGARFSSLNPEIVGLRFGYQDHHFMDFVSPAGTFTRWDSFIEDPFVKVFADVALSLGKGNPYGPPGEDGRLVAIRRPCNLGFGCGFRSDGGEWWAFCWRWVWTPPSILRRCVRRKRCWTPSRPCPPRRWRC